MSKLLGKAAADGTVYTGLKAALDGIGGVCARELGPRKTRVNTINPSGIG
jgi:3-oxoacyl-[acyl-carrier protein] reductase